MSGSRNRKEKERALQKGISRNNPALILLVHLPIVFWPHHHWINCSPLWPCSPENMALPLPAGSHKLCFEVTREFFWAHVTVLHQQLSNSTTTVSLSIRKTVADYVDSTEEHRHGVTAEDLKVQAQYWRSQGWWSAEEWDLGKLGVAKRIQNIYSMCRNAQLPS